MAETVTSLVSTAWLHDNLTNPDIRIVDATWYMPGAGSSGLDSYREAHIPGAVFFDIDKHSDHQSPLPHMLPTPDAFAADAGALGISDDHHIIVYDSQGLLSAPRVWWTFTAMGARSVSVLDGGLPRWRAEGRPLTTDVPKPATTRFRPKPDNQAVAALADVRHASRTGAVQIVDARSAGRFNGEAPEPRPGLPSGCMPGSINLPFDQLLEEGALLPVDQLSKAFQEAGVDLDQPMITTCGSGVTAAILSLALEQIGVTPAGLYDGSWTEWAGRDDTKVVVAKSS